MIYASESYPLPVLEVLVHADQSILQLDYVFVELTLPSDTLPQQVAPSDLPPDWASAHGQVLTKELGRKWLAEKSSLALAVPSAVIPLAHNVLLNPAHPDIHQVKVGPPIAFEFDPRLFKFTLPAP